MTPRGGGPAVSARPEMNSDAPQGHTWVWAQAAEALVTRRREGDGAHLSQVLSASQCSSPYPGSIQCPEGL